MAAEKIFLIGLMGSGKSYWSKKMSKWIKSAGYDLDALIEMNEEKTIAELFAEDGEEYFRKTETKLLKWFKEKKKYVLATGGGTPCFNENMQWMKKEGIVIWLDESLVGCKNGFRWLSRMDFPWDHVFAVAGFA